MAGLLRRFRFANFLDQGAGLACAEAEAFAEGFPDEGPNPLVLYGAPGMGKTHLLHAVGNAVAERLPSAWIRLPAPGGEVPRSGEAGLALVDDLEPRWADWLAASVAAAPRTRWCLAAGSDPRDWPNLPESLAAWLAGGRVTDLSPPGREVFEALLAERLASWGPDAELGPGVRAFLFEHFGASPGRFLAALDRLWAHKLLQDERAGVAELVAFLRAAEPERQAELFPSEARPGRR